MCGSYSELRNSTLKTLCSFLILPADSGIESNTWLFQKHSDLSNICTCLLISSPPFHRFRFPEVPRLLWQGFMAVEGEKKSLLSGLTHPPSGKRKTGHKLRLGLNYYSGLWLIPGNFATPINFSRGFKESRMTIVSRASSSAKVTWLKVHPKVEFCMPIPSRYVVGSCYRQDIRLHQRFLQGKHL